jgi:NAD(P)-dependent dehydrogenase (short-subunit alcohol dehydrogenase family)
VAALLGELDGRVALVTGAAGGIGAACVRALESAGATVFAVDLAEGFAGHRADVTRADEVERAVAAAVELHGRLDVVVTAAGISGRRYGDGPAHACTEEAWDRTLEGNLKSVFLTCKYAIPYLIDAGGGSIVNISSVVGIVGGDEDFATHAYGASKGGVVALTKGIAVYYGPRGVRCNVICPGVIDTPMAFRSVGDPRIRARLRDLHPLTGEPGLPEDVAAAVLYLAGPDSSFVTGAVLPVDGGWTAR